MTQTPVYEILKEAARQWPEKTAVFDEWGQMSFTQLYSEAEELRLRLTEAGLQKGMCIGMIAGNGRYFIIGLFAAAGTGAAVMPMSPQLKKNEIADIVHEARLHVLLSYHDSAEHEEETALFLPLQYGAFHYAPTGIDTKEIFASFVEQPAFMRFTSGTTGKSKGVILSHQSVLERIEGANEGLGLNQTDTVVWVLPMAYHFIVSIVLYIKYGAAIAIVPDFMAKNIIENTNRYKGTMLYASPVQIRLLAHDKSDIQMPSLKKVISTSAGISIDVCRDFKTRFHLDVSQAYGIIEIGLPILNFNSTDKHPEAVGFVLPGYTADILNDAYQPLPAGSIGTLGIKGPGMFDAYLVPPVLRNDVLHNGYFLTADFASKTEDGLIKIEGRSKSVINISGIKIFPEEVETLLEQIPEIEMARVSSKPHPLLGQIIEAEIVLYDGKTINVEDTLSYCKKRLSGFKAPQRIIIVDALPMTGSGKLQRH